MNKFAGLEPTEVNDSAWGRPIRVSTSARLVFRHEFAQRYPDIANMRNARLNEYIATIFSNSSGRRHHFFKLGKKDDAQRDWAEIRSVTLMGFRRYFISAVRQNSVDILVIQTKFFKPKFFIKTPQNI